MTDRRGQAKPTAPARRLLPSRTAILLSASLLSACGFDETQAPTPAAEPLPKEVCAQSKQAVERLEKSGGLVLNSPTDAVMMQQAWLELTPAARDALLTAMALAATCAGEPRLEQEVTVHSDTGTLLVRRVVQTSYSLADALGS